MNGSSPLDGKVAIVTGASSGLGVAVAQRLASAGATVVAMARRREQLESLAHRHPGIRAQVCDITRAEEVAHAIDRVHVDFGRIDVLVNNAGISSQKPAEETNVDEFRRVLELNLVSQFHITSAVGARMLEQQSGSIVNVASIFGLVAAAPTKQVAYAASKGGLISMTRHLAVEWADRGVRVNAIAPGFFRSELTEAIFDDERAGGWVARNTPLGRPAELDEVTGLVAFLAGDESSYLTGTVIPVDGGWTAR